MLMLILSLFPVHCPELEDGRKKKHSYPINSSAFPLQFKANLEDSSEHSIDGKKRKKKEAAKKKKSTGNNL